MGDTTKIEWADKTFNGWIGCTPVSGACDHCYAQTLSERYGWAEWGVGKPRHRTSAENWKKPLAWDRKAAKLGIRYRVFSNSLSDWADKEVPDEWRDDAMQVIEATPHLDWLLLTKRPKVMREYFERRGSVPGNVWAGTTAENQPMLDLRAPDLMAIKSAKHFLSMEPLLEAVTISPRYLMDLDWVIVGGESGNDWRPINPDWVRSIRDQCQTAGVYFHFKQWAGWNPKTLGRLLDGREWNEVPGMAA